MLQNSDVIETDVHRFQLIDGILHAYAKPLNPSIEELKNSLDVMQELAQGNKLLILMDPSDAIGLNQKQRALVVERFSELAGAVAIINNNFIVPLVYRLMVKRWKEFPFEMELFKNKEEALEWLKTFKEK